MKKTIYLMVLSMVISLTASCGSAALETPSTGGSATLSASYPNAVSVEEQLIFGTIQLDGTDLAVEAAQAQELLPLWQTLRSLESSDTAAEEEIAAVLEQIQDTMTAEQLRTIQDHQITREAITEILRQQGMNIFGNRGGSGSDSANPSVFDGEFPEGGFIIEGGGPAPAGGAAMEPPAGGMVFGPGAGGGEGGGFGGGSGSGRANLTQEQIATLQAGRGQNGGTRMSAGMTGIIIRYLEKVINPESEATPPAPPMDAQATQTPVG